MNRVIVIGTSAGGVKALAALLSHLPHDLPAAVLLVMHIGNRRSELPDVLQRHCAMPVAFAVDQQALIAGTVSVAPPDHHLLVVRKDARLHIALSRAAKENHTRPAIDPLFRTAAAAADGCTVGVILSGYLDDGVVGLQAIQACGGVAMVQDPAEAAVPDMPNHALNRMRVDLCAPLEALAAALVRYAATMAPDVGMHPIPRWLTLENQVAAGDGGLLSLQQIAAPSRYACPDCGGVLFAVRDPQPARYRCHTGHSYTLLALLSAQRKQTEDALRMALRSVQEQQSLLDQLASETADAHGAPMPGYLALCRRSSALAQELRSLLQRHDNPD